MNGAVRLESERFFLTRLGFRDLEDLIEIEGDIQHQRYLGGSGDRRRVRRSLGWGIAEFDKRGYGVLGIRRGDEMVGYAGILPSAVDEGEDVEVVCSIKKEFRSQGIAGEVLPVVLRWGLDDLGFSKLLGRVSASNAASARLVKRLGMETICDRIDPATGEAETVYCVRKADPKGGRSRPPSG